jgi:protein phosphatase
MSDSRRAPQTDLASFRAGGIGKSIETVEQLEALQRPLTMETGGMVLMDLLWRCVLLSFMPAGAMRRSLTRPCGSDPTENDGVLGLRPNARGPGLVTFGPDRVKEFCEANNLQMIIRAHECVMDGAALMRAQTAV